MPKEMEAHIVHCSSQNRRLLVQEYLVLILVKGYIVRVIGFIKVKKDVLKSIVSYSYIVGADHALELI